MMENYTTDLIDTTMASNNTTLDHDHAPICTSGGDCLHIFIIPIICVFGVIGNLFSFKVFVFTSFGRKSSGIFLAALSVSDTGFLLSLFFTWLSGGQIGVHIRTSPIYCQCVVFVTYVCSFLSVWYVVLLMLERYVVVCHPLKVKIWCCKRRSLFSVVIVAAFAFLFYSHTFVTSVIRNEQCAIAEEYIGIVMFFTYIDTAVTFLFPIVLVFVMNIIIILSIRRFRKRQVRMVCFQDEKSNKSPKRLLSVAEFRITRMLIVVSTVFIITNLPSHAMRLYIMIFQNNPDKANPIIAQIQLVCNLLYFCNFALNFFLYSSTSKIFRKFVCLKFPSRCPGSQFSSRTNTNNLTGNRNAKNDFLYVRRSRLTPRGQHMA